MAIRLRTSVLAVAAASALVLVSPTPADGGGSGENVILLVDPSNPDALRLANHYRDARGVPEANLLYMSPDGETFQELAANQIEGFVGTLAARGALDRASYVLVLPTSDFRVRAPGLVSDGCVALGHFAIGSAYGMAFIRDDILATVNVTEANRYFAGAVAPVAFDGTATWLAGMRSDDPAAKRYLIGGMLGHTGARGNTADELVALIDRSAAADASFPDGTFYFQQTNDTNRSAPRHDSYAALVSSLAALGFAAEHRMGFLPVGEQDCLGIMTGVADPAILTSDFTLLPGSFADHLTSFAGHFDSGSQTKMSEWITKGASGSAGAVEEPCNYPGKFPHPLLHLWYAQGATLGEAWYGSTRYVPFQTLFYGDPLTQPFAHIPQVTLDGIPGGVARGYLRLLPEATTTHPTATLGAAELLIDGRSLATVPVGETYVLNTLELADGHHDLRALVRDDSSAETIGAFRGGIVIDNRGQSCTLSVIPTTGDLGTSFALDVDAAGAELREIVVLHNGRVIAATTDTTMDPAVFGQALGAGPVVLQAEAVFAGDLRVRSVPFEIDVAATGGGASAAVPSVFSFTRRADPGNPYLIELPASFTDAPGDVTYSLVEGPSMGSLLTSMAGGFRLLDPMPGASGTDTIRFKATNAEGDSAEATITLDYDLPVMAPRDVVTVRTGRLSDSRRTDRDAARVSGTLTAAAGGPPSFDPETDSLRIVVGDVDTPLSIVIPAGDKGWRSRRGRFIYRSPRGARPRVSLSLTSVTGAFLLRVSRAEFATPPQAPIQVTIGGSATVATTLDEWQRPARRQSLLRFP